MNQFEAIRRSFAAQHQMEMARLRQRRAVIDMNDTLPSGNPDLPQVESWVKEVTARLKSGNLPGEGDKPFLARLQKAAEAASPELWRYTLPGLVAFWISSNLSIGSEAARVSLTMAAVADGLDPRQVLADVQRKSEDDLLNRLYPTENVSPDEPLNEKELKAAGIETKEAQFWGY